MAGDWLEDFANIMDSATGLVKATSTAINPPKMTTTAETPAGTETAPKQKVAAVETNEGKPSEYPWLIIVLAVAIAVYALTES